MKLINFLLEVDGEKIRDIKFNDSLNIIINDKTISNPGNSIGKSTLGRVLDYLFDGSINDIYVDKDTDSPNKDIEKIFINHEVFSSLTYVGLCGKTYTIKRQLLIENNSKNYYINGKSVKAKNYRSHILETVFNVLTDKPTIRKLAPKFFRTNHFRMLHNTKLLNEYSTASKNDLSIVMLYLFGFENTSLLTDKHILNNKNKKYENQRKALGSIIKDEKIKGTIEDIKKQINKLESSLLATDNEVDKLELVSEINRIDDQENSHLDLLINLGVKIKNIQRTNNILSDDDQNYLISELNNIYQYASVNIDAVLRDYDASLQFHNKLVTAKKDFLSSGLPALENKKYETEQVIQKLRNDKNSLLAQIRSKQSLDKLSETIKEIGELNKDLIKNSAIIEQQKLVENNQEDTKNKLAALSKELKEQLSSVNEFESKFIENFKLFTKEFYDVEYNFSLNLNQDKGECSPIVDDVQSNNEGGLKRLEIISFDLAYMKTVNDMQSNRPTFVLHDSIDDIDIELVEKMFEISQRIHGQQIVSMLSDKLSKEQYKKYKPCMILELTKDDKFFRV